MRHPFALALILAVPNVHACMGIGREPVRFAGQTNIVIWDAKREVEHFIRDAHFDTKAKDLGFIAPSPTKPEIESVSSYAFERLESLKPPQPQKSVPYGADRGGGLAGGVSVVQQTYVAGYKATVIKATDARELAAWLQRNGYAMPRYGVQWLAEYVRAGWYLTAFKVATQNGAGATGPVRMTFEAAVPFNPYAVPGENTGSGGLRLYYISAGDEEAKIGRTKPWLNPEWSAPVTESVATAVNSNLRLGDVPIPEGATVKFYRDPSFGRPGFDDIYFVRQPSPSSGRSAEAVVLGSLGAIAFGTICRRRI